MSIDIKKKDNTSPTLVKSMLDRYTCEYIFARPNFLVQNSLFYTTITLDNATLRISVFSY